MNIQILSCANTRCGIGRYTNELGERLTSTEHQVKVFRKDSPKAPTFEVFPHRSFRSLRHYVAPMYLGKAIRKIEADIWHADYVDAASAFFWSGKKASGKLYTNVHDAIPFLFPTSKSAFNYYKRQLDFATKLSEKLIVVSEVSKKDLIRFTGIDPDKIVVIYNGINHDFFFPNKEPQQNNVFTIRYIGGLSGPHKNAETLIETARILEEKGYEFLLEIGGGHPENTNLPGLVEKYGLKNVRFRGFIDDEYLRDFLASADLFLYPSNYEGFGFPPLEAMACGTATVSSNAGSLGEVLGDGALTVEPTPEALALATEQVLLDPDFKSLLEEKAITQSSKYTWQKSAEAHLALFQSNKKTKTVSGASK